MPANAATSLAPVLRDIKHARRNSYVETVDEDSGRRDTCRSVSITGAQARQAQKLATTPADLELRNATRPNIAWVFEVFHNEENNPGRTLPRGTRAARSRLARAPIFTSSYVPPAGRSLRRGTAGDTLPGRGVAVAQMTSQACLPVLNLVTRPPRAAACEAIEFGSRWVAITYAGADALDVSLFRLALLI